MAEDQTTPQAGPKKKRNRIDLACSRCRDRKVRCDGKQPSCSRCAKKLLPCEYPKREKNRYSSEYVKSLERQLGAIQRVSPSGDSSVLVNPLAYPQTTKEDKRPSLRFTTSEGSVSTAPAQPSPSIINSEDSFTTAQSQPLIPTQGYSREIPVADAMGATSTGTGVSHRDFYGSSSAMSFMNLVKAAVNADKEEACPRIPNEERSKPRKPLFRRHAGRDNWVLPPRRVADLYVDSYFTYSYSLYPFVHKPTFEALYESLWNGTGTDADDQLFYCIFNLVLALGCILSPNVGPETKNETAEMYFERTMEHMHLDVCEDTSLLLLQTLLLTSQFLQATYRPGACWNVIGLAIRVAQEQGLHRNSHIQCRSSLIDQQMCRRLWYGCIIMDRIASTTFGRPLMITQDFGVEYPVFIDDDCITDRAILSPTLSAPPSIMLFFQHTIRLYDVLADVLKSFYDICMPENQEADPRTDMLKTVLEIEGKLDEFRQRLPVHLQLDNPPSNALDPIRRRQKNVLLCRYLHVEIMLYRPLLFPNGRISYYGEHNLRSTMQQTVAKMCVNSAIKLVKLIYDYKDTPDTPAAWYSIYYVYTSAAVLLAAKIQPSLNGIMDLDAMASSWKMALQYLRDQQTLGTSASRCLRILELLHDKISYTTQGPEKPMFDLLPESINSRVNASQELDDLYALLNDQLSIFTDFMP
ncbi:hypothetical protein TRICI_002125 [Trichomonascus ciferrii]|uniref:Zn(2)-C6 fungal-type domain-containing protein n=1 Tax=Trichomonascus ciferrii TaxID=44093 RepID=A0A642V6M0_9ASCO|nr:hypothetical protein TRICI_002125 [Trichomonascus ciferrii]